MAVALGVENRSIAATIEKLRPTWEALLERAPIGEHDNFFELGGGPSLAVKLFDEISRSYGRELPPLVIYHAPTIASLAAVLEQPTLPQFSPIVPLKNGSAASPVFLAHGLGGTVMEFVGLVNNVESHHAIYGLQAIAENGADMEFERIEEMAQFYTDAIRRQQPHGPYRIIGYSLGGLVALEIAQLLLKMGESISLLVLLDAYPHQSALGFGQWTRHVARLAAYHASMIRQLPVRFTFPYLLSSAERMRYAPKGDAESFIRKPYTTLMRLARDKAYLALTEYRPRPYGGRVRFVKAAEPSVFPVDPKALWAPWVRDLEVEIVPGNHYKMITRYCKPLGLLLSRYLNEAE
jgi:acetoacetyl-CoA synthetase